MCFRERECYNEMKGVGVFGHEISSGMYHIRILKPCFDVKKKKKTYKFWKTT